MKDFFNKETLDNIKQFCTENKKYVGVAAILIGLILILIVVVAGGHNDRRSDTESGSQEEISVKDFAQKHGLTEVEFCTGNNTCKLCIYLYSLIIISKVPN